jgi:predicted TIM-barrel fold metal-dependent hydrolase
VATNDAWLGQVTEQILDPELPICDPHHHLWDSWAGATVDARYLLDELLGDINTGHNIVSTVFIECGTMFNASASDMMAPVGETEFVNGIAAMSASGMYGSCRVAAGIIGTAYLSQGDGAGAVLDAHMAAGGGRFRGVRQAATFDPSPDVGNHRTGPPADLYSLAKFREGFAHLTQRDLTFEAWCYHTQIPSLADLARAFPDTTIILNHVGGPIGVGPYAGKRDEVFAQWSASITELSRCPNVVAKLGGLGMPVTGFGFHEGPSPPTSSAFLEPTRPYFEHVLDAFGANRCMFESNFPVDKVSVSYPVLWNAFKRLTSGYSTSERASLFHDTAARVYRL